MTKSEEVKVRKRRSSQEIRRLVTEFEASGLRQVEFCNNHGLALSTLQRGLKRRRREAGGQGECERLVEVKVARSRRNGSAESSCALEVLLAKGRRIEVRRDFDAETLTRLIRTIEESDRCLGLDQRRGSTWPLERPTCEGLRWTSRNRARQAWTESPDRASVFVC